MVRAQEEGATTACGGFQLRAQFSRRLQGYSSRASRCDQQHNRTAAMSPVEPSSDSSSVQSLTLPELIFSCGICQATVSDVYATAESNKGFHSGSGDDDGIVTRFWIAECSHVSCGKHLAGGGVLRRVDRTNIADRPQPAAPFHPHGEQPRAPCPQCIQSGDKTPKSLYGIRGLDEGEHDPSIPRTWFQCPPIRLDGSAPGMDAVRVRERDRVS